MFVLDDTLSNSNPRPGTTLRVHLREPLVVGGVTVAAAGAPDRIRISKTVKSAAIAAPQFTVTIFPLPIGAAGNLPLAITPAVVPLANLVAATPLAAKTEATLTEANGRVAMHIPVPFALTNDAPYADWTPIPLRTAPSVATSARPGNRGNGRRGSSPAPSSSASGSRTAAPAPAAPSPEPTGTGPLLIPSRSPGAGSQFPSQSPTPALFSSSLTSGVTR